MLGEQSSTAGKLEIFAFLYKQRYALLVYLTGGLCRLTLCRDGYASDGRRWRWLQPPSSSVQDPVPSVWNRTACCWTVVPPADLSSAAPTGGPAHPVCQTVQQRAGTLHTKRHCVTFETCATLFVNARCIYFSQFVCFVGFRSPTCLMLPTRCVWWFRKNEAWTSWRFVRFIKVFSMCEDADVRHFSQWLGPLFRNSLSLTAGIWFWTLEWEGDFPPKKALVGGAVSPKPAFWNICYHSFCNSYLSSYE